VSECGSRIIRRRSMRGNTKFGLWGPHNSGGEFVFGRAIGKAYDYEGPNWNSG